MKIYYNLLILKGFCLSLISCQVILVNFTYWAFNAEYLLRPDDSCILNLLWQYSQANEGKLFCGATVIRLDLNAGGRGGLGSFLMAVD